MTDGDHTPTPSDERSEQITPRPAAMSFASAVVGIVAVVALIGGVVGFWALRTASDSDRFERVAEGLLRDEEISDALAVRVVDEVAEAIDVRGALHEIAPDRLDPVVDVLLAGVRSRVDQRVGQLLRSDIVASTVSEAAGRSYEVAIKVIEGDSVVDGVDVSDGAVRVNLLPLTARAIGALQEVGLFRDVDVPEFARGGDPDEQRQQLGDALGRDLPEGFGQPVMFRSDWLDEAGNTVQLARDALVLAKRTFWVLLVVGVALGAASIWLARRRLRAAAYLVAGLFAGTLAVRLFGAETRTRAPDIVDDVGARAAVTQIATGLEESLNRTMLWFSLLALLALLVALWAVVRLERGETMHDDQH